MILTTRSLFFQKNIWLPLLVALTPVTSFPLYAAVKTTDVKKANDNFESGLRYYHGHNVAQSYSQAREYFQKAADLGHAEAQFYLGALYERGKGVARNYKTAFSWYQKAADQGL